MYSRVTLFEIDTMRMDVDEALGLFKRIVLPELRRQPGYEGLYVLLSPEGRGELISLWGSQEAAEASVLSGFYAEQVEKFISLYRAPPGREHYEVAFAELKEAARA